MKLNRKEFDSHKKLCTAINKEFEKQEPLVNNMTKDDLNKKREEFLNVMDSIENLNFFSKIEKSKEDDKNEINREKLFNNEDMNLLVKSLIFIFSRKMSFIEDKINKINSTIEQFSENNLIFYQSINDELENINQKISSINNNENISNKNSTQTCNNENNNIFSPKNIGFNSPTVTNTKEIYSKNKTIFRNKDEKLLLSNTIINERQNSVKGLDKLKTLYTNELINSSRNKSKKRNKFEINEKIKNIGIDKNKNSVKKGTTINNLINKEKFIKGLKSTKYMEKIKGIQNKKQNLIINADNLENKLKNEYINTNIINGQRNNYIISNNFNTINSYHDKTYSEKSSSKGIEQNLSGGNNQDLLNNNTIK